MRLLMRVLLLAGWVGAAPLLGLAAGVNRADLLVVVPAAVMLVALVVEAGARLRARLLALPITNLAVTLLAVRTWGLAPGVALVLTAYLVADEITSFLRPPSRRGNRPGSRA
ncbi:hypothetical protein AB0392_32295 [Nonomuraea angiospora]|uniref:hypothetical protein n=1 Tax=Nonomuraea angiospora TaxID=46172 RepID=UPI00344C34B7